MRSVKCEINFIDHVTNIPTVLFQDVLVSDTHLDVSKAVSSFNNYMPTGSLRSFWVGPTEISNQAEEEGRPKYRIPRQLQNLDPGKLTMHYKLQELEPDSQGELENGEEGKQRSKERTIREVLVGVKRWRRLHDIREADKSRMSLQEAAKKVGFSKKSLDDYYCQLRLAEKFDFDFAGNFDQKIGMLRNFVKSNRRTARKKTFKKKNQKISKELKIMDLIELSEQHSLSNHESVLPVEPEPQESSGQIGLAPIDRELEEEFQNQFYRDILLLETDPIDPFLPFGPNDYRQIQPFSFDLSFDSY